jgi:hypothetical protein
MEPSNSIPACGRALAANGAANTANRSSAAGRADAWRWKTRPTAWEFGPGVGFLVPAGFSGTWEVIEECTKFYVIFEART